MRASLVLCSLLLAGVNALCAQEPVCTGQAIVNCRIDRPIVNSPSPTQYLAVKFSAGDKVKIFAGGCVQTGGTGDTWKRYVNPKGPDSDHLYYGEIHLPGVTSGYLDRISGYNGREFTIPPGIQDAALVLGYTDDDYSDNGYYRHDNGTDNQCKNLGDAWVRLIITRSQQAQQPVTPKSMDLVASNGFDWNGLPLNPRWGFEKEHEGSHPDPSTLCSGFSYLVLSAIIPGAPIGPSPCTSQWTWLNFPTLGNSSFNSVICGFGEGTIHGHLNWSAATYTGKLHWGDHSWSDDDYDWYLWPDNKSGLTTANLETIKLEFDSDETVDNIEKGWWNDFHSAVNNGDLLGTPAFAMNAIGETASGPPDAIVIGLLGLDIEHAAPSELHPVYGMAIHLKDDLSDDIWAIMGRRQGNEGFCSEGQEVLPVTSLKFLIPRANVSNVTVVESSLFAGQSNVTASVTYVSGGALVTLNLPSPGTLVSGSLRLAWTPLTIASGGNALRVLSRPAAFQFGNATLAAQTQLREWGDAEDRVRVPVLRLPVVKQNEFRQLNMPLRQRASYPVKLVAQPPLALLAKPTSVPKVRWAPDPRKKERELVRARLLCDSYGGNIPGLPKTSCAKVTRQR